jgi:hypothetical protein
MDREQAKEILLRYRPGCDDTVDPQVVEALALLEQDPELAAWFEEQQRADDAIRAAMSQMPVPADLKQRILAEQKIVRPEFAWRRPVLIAAAAGIMLGAISLWAFRAGVIGGVAAYRAEMVGHVEKGYLMSVRASTFDQLRQILSEKKWPSDFIVPDRLRNVTVIGGSALEWKGHKVALACMKDHSRGLWLFVVENAAFRHAPDTETPHVKMVGASPTAIWSQSGNTYLLTVQGDEAFLKRYLPVCH